MTAGLRATWNGEESFILKTIYCLAPAVGQALLGAQDVIVKPLLECRVDLKIQSHIQGSGAIVLKNQKMEMMGRRETGARGGPASRTSLQSLEAVLRSLVLTGEGSLVLMGWGQGRLVPAPPAPAPQKPLAHTGPLPLWQHPTASLV